MKPATFDQLYQDVPADKRVALQQFRTTHPYRHLDAGTIHWEYIACGQGDQAILILGGGVSVGETSFRTILRLEKNFRIISPSYPSVGKMDMVADGLAAILDREGIPQAHVFGHSLGSAVGHVFVRLFPGRVDRLILDGFGLYTPSHTRATRLFLKLPYPLLRAYYRRVFKKLLADPGDPEEIFMRAYVEELFTSLHTRQTLMGQFNLLIDIFDHVDQYAVSQPVERPGKVLLILADDDRGFTPQEREALKASYPGAQVHTFASGGHLAGFTRSEEFNAVLDSFLNS